MTDDWTDDDWPDEPTEKRMAYADVAPKTEPELLAAIDQQDHAMRVVYADWLEEQGDLQRAEYVRLQDLLVTLPPGDARTATITRVQWLAANTDAAWRMLVARPRIKNCSIDACPREWGSLVPTSMPDLRECGTCKRPVAYLFEVRTPRGALVVLDNVYDNSL